MDEELPISDDPRYEFSRMEGDLVVWKYRSYSQVVEDRLRKLFQPIALDSRMMVSLTAVSSGRSYTVFSAAEICEMARHNFLNERELHKAISACNGSREIVLDKPSS